MTTNHCSTETSGRTTCVTCTGQPAIPHIPAHVVTAPIVGWNGGANSVKHLDGDQRTVFEVGPSAGSVVGFAAPPRPVVTDPSTISHGWYVQTINGHLFAQVMEAGALRGAAHAVGYASRLEIRRVGGDVTYRINEAERYASAVPSFGLLRLGAALFASGDTVE